MCDVCAISKGIVQEADLIITQETERKTRELLGISEFDMDRGITKMKKHFKEATHGKNSKDKSSV